MSTSESKKSSSSKHSKKEHQEDKNAPDIPIEEVMKNTSSFFNKTAYSGIYSTLYQSFS
jgi:hypothetical protein